MIQALVFFGTMRVISAQGPANFLCVVPIVEDVAKDIAKLQVGFKHMPEVPGQQLAEILLSYL